ncbi:MAG: hypothetical protein ACR2JR_08230 [Rubrobacteraceae bacterium]
MVTYFVRMTNREESGRAMISPRCSENDPNESCHETRESEELVNAHESSAPFLECRERLLVEGESVV